MKSEESFGSLLTKMISEAGFSNAEFFRKMNMNKQYFYEIIGDRTNPPPPEKQFEMIELLEPNDETKAQFFNLAARARDEMPADVSKYVKENDLYDKLRTFIVVNN